MNTTALLISLIATIGFGLIAVLMAQSTRKIGPIATLMLFEGLGIPLLLILIPIMQPAPNIIRLWQPAVIGIFFSFVYILYLYAVKIGELSVVAPINQLYAVITAILGIVFLHESFGLWKSIGILLIFIGVVLIGVKFSTKNFTHTTLLAGVPYAIISAVGTGFYLFIVALSARSNGWFYTALTIRIVMTITTLLLLYIRKFNFSSLRNTPWKIVGAAAVADVIAFSMYNYAIANFEVSTVTMITSLQIGVVAMLSWIFLKEKLNKQQCIGFVIALTGLISLQIP